MSTTTPNYGLVKPQLTDTADITAMNPNWDKIDQELKKKYGTDNKPTASDVGALPLDGSVPMSGALDIVQENKPSVTLYTGETKDTATERVRFGQEYGYLKLSHRVITGDETSLQISGKKGFTPIVVVVDDVPYALFGEHNTDLLKNYVLPLDGRVPMTGDFIIVKDLAPAITLYEGEDVDTAEIAVKILANTMGAEFQHRDYSSNKYVSLWLDANAATGRELSVALKGGGSNVIFGEHNKPSGSYTGNGSATQRTVTVGGIGEVLTITSDTGMALVTNRGAICLNRQTGVLSGLKSYEVNYQNGVLTIAIADAFVNGSSIAYWYQVL
jgi:hypothetical protein